MNGTVMEKWGKALLSGAYQQGAGYLERFGMYDPLGVLCHLASTEQVVERIPLDCGRVLYRGPELGSLGNASTAYLPVVVQRWADLPEMPMVALGMPAGPLIPISALNDAGWTFGDLWLLILEQL